MKLLVTIVAVVLATPVLLVVGIALGPAILVILFIAGIALVTCAVVWLVESAKSHHASTKQMERVHR